MASTALASLPPPLSPFAVPAALSPVTAGRAVTLKFDAVTPVILLLNVTVHATEAALVGFAPARLIETTFGAIV